MRARNIKPGFFKNEVLGELNPLIRILFEGLWCVADREGRFEWRPKRLKAEILPYDNGDITVMLRTLCEKEFIRYYQVQGKEYGLVVHFLDHQSPHHTEKASIIPPLPDNGEVTVNSPLRDGENPPDSLIPDSLIPEIKPSSHKKNDPFNDQAREVVEYLNKKTGKAYSQTKHIKARLKDGGTIEQCKQIIDTKIQDPYFQKNPKYLNPETLFRPTNWDKYLNECPDDYNRNGSPESQNPAYDVIRRGDD